MYEEKKLYLNDFLSNPKQFWDSGFLFLYIQDIFLKTCENKKCSIQVIF